MAEARLDLSDVVHPEEDVEGAVDVGIELARPVDGLLPEREMQRHQAVVAPVPGIELLAHVVGKELAAGHRHGGGRVDGARDQPFRLDRLAVRQTHAAGAAVGDDDLLHLGVHHHGAAGGRDDPGERQRQAHRPADRQGEFHHVGKDRREDDPGARDALRGDDVHVGGEQGPDAIVVEMLAHHAEQVVLRMGEKLPALRPGQAVAKLCDRQRCVVQERAQQRPHSLAVELMQLAEGLRVAPGEARQGAAGGVDILVDHDAGAVAKRRRLLHRRLDIGVAEPIELEVVHQGRVAEAHEEIGMEVEAIAGQRRLFGAGAAAELAVALDHADAQAGTRQIGCEREAVVACADDQAIVTRHARPRWTVGRAAARPSSPVHPGSLPTSRHATRSRAARRCMLWRRCGLGNSRTMLSGRRPDWTCQYAISRRSMRRRKPPC